MKIFLLGYRKLDFSDSKDPDRKIQGFSLFLAQEAEGVEGVVPVSNEGKRFLSSTVAKKIGITDNWLDDRIDSFIDIDINFDGKIVDISDYDSEKKSAV